MGNDRHPLLQKSIGGNKPSWFAVNARRVVTIVAQVRSNEIVVRRCGEVLEIFRKQIKIYNMRIAARLLVDDEVKIDERMCLVAYWSLSVACRSGSGALAVE